MACPASHKTERRYSIFSCDSQNRLEAVLGANNPSNSANLLRTRNTAFFQLLSVGSGDAHIREWPRANFRVHASETT